MSTQLPNHERAQRPSEITNEHCVNCQRDLKGESDYHKDVKVCKDCIDAFLLIETHLHQLAEQRMVKVKNFVFGFGGENK